MSATYYVRIAGKVYGAFEAGKLKNLAAGGKLARDHEISRDRVKWVSAGKVKGLFPPATLIVERPSRTVPVEAIVASSPPVPQPEFPRELPGAGLARAARDALSYAPAAAPPWPAIRRLPVGGVWPRGNGYALVAALVGFVALAGWWMAQFPAPAIPLALLGMVLAGFGLLVARYRGGAGLLASLGGGIVLAVAVGVGMTVSGQREQPLRPKTEPPRWAELSAALQIGDARVSLVSAAIGKVPLEGLFEEGQSSEDLLMIRLTIENLSATRKLDFRGFSPEFAGLDFAQLTDNHENWYRRVGFGSARPKGQVKINSIYPGKSMDDLLVFETPVETAAYLRLELPALHVGEEGAFRFQISCASIER